MPKKSRRNLFKNDMPGFALQLAAADNSFQQNVKQAMDSPRFNPRDILIALSVGLAVGFALFLWAYLRSRKQPDLMDRSNVVRERSSASSNSSNSSATAGERRKRRRKRRRRDHRPRNPSLQQTGGLPPPRSDDDLPKF
jgi:hypothetical protein